MRVPEGVRGVRVRVSPGLAALAIGEVPVGATRSNIHDNVELLVEGGVDITLVGPRVVALAPATSFPEGLGGGVNVEDYVVGSIEVSGETILGPEQTVDMEVVRKGLGVSVLLRGLQVAIGVISGSPVEGGGELVVAAGLARGVVTARLHNVDLTGRGPSTVSLVLWEHPDGGPQEISLRKLSLDLNLSVLEGELADGADAGGLNWVDHVAGGGRVALTAVEGVGGADGGRAATPDVDVTVVEGVIAEVVNGESWLEEKDAVLNERVGPVVGVPLELPVAATAHGDLVLPIVEVKLVELVLPDEGVGEGRAEKSEKNTAKISCHLK